MCFPVNKCCFCISLEIGTKVISVLSLIFSTVIAAVYAGAAVAVPAAAQAQQCFYMLVAAVGLCHVLVCCLLVYGLFWSKPSYLWPWLATCWVSCGCLLLLSLLGVALLTIQYYEDEETFADISAMSTSYFIYAAILYYCAAAVRGRRLQLLRAREAESAETLMQQQHMPKIILV